MPTRNLRDFAENPNHNFKFYSLIVFAVIVSLLALSTLFGSFYTVDQAERAVLLRNGAFVAVEEPGLHFKLPFIDSAVMIGNYQRTVRWDNSSGRDYRQDAYSQDQQPAKFNLSVIWHIPAANVDKVYASYRSADGAEANLIDRRVPQDVKTVFGQFTAVSAIQDRAKLNAEVLRAVQADPEIVGSPIVIDGVQIEDIEFSASYIGSVEAAMKARVEVQKLEQQQRQEEITARITVIRANASADAAVKEAEGKAKAVTLAGNAEASAIHAKGDALKDNPQLVDLTRAERWNGVLPTTMLPSGALPFLTTPTK